MRYFLDRLYRTQAVIIIRHNRAASCILVYSHLSHYEHGLGQRVSIGEASGIDRYRIYILCWYWLGHGLELDSVSHQRRDISPAGSSDRIESSDVFSLCQSLWAVKGTVLT